MSKPPEIFNSELDWTEVAKVLHSEQRFVLTSHVRPDSDGIGSALALARHLRRVGKQARVLLPSAPPDRLRALDPDGWLEVYGPEDAAYVGEAVVIVLDLSDCERLGPMAPVVEAGVRSTICVDHHINVEHEFADLNIIDPTAPSTGVLIHDLLVVLGAEYDATTATAIYATVVADTGGFRFSNTNSRVLRLAGDLIDLGADPVQVARLVHSSYSLKKMRLLSRALTDSVVECDGQLSWCAVSRDTLEAAGASVEDTDGLVEYLRLLDTVRAAALFVELADGVVKVSLRSERPIDVNRVARMWNGGGHRYASGATLDGPLKSATEQVLVETRKLFD